MQFIDNRTTRCHCHVWVCCFGTNNIMISCMSLILIHVYYFSLIVIFSYHSCISEPLVVPRNLLIVGDFGTVSSFFKWKTQHCSLLYNHIQPTLLPPKYWQGIETPHTWYIKFILETGARLKEPVYVCIGQQFGWEIYFLLLNELNLFGLCLSRELVRHLITQVNNGLLAVYITFFTWGGVSVGASSPSS